MLPELAALPPVEGGSSVPRGGVSAFRGEGQGWLGRKIRLAKPARSPSEQQQCKPRRLTVLDIVATPALRLTPQKGAGTRVAAVHGARGVGGASQVPVVLQGQSRWGGWVGGCTDDGMWAHACARVCGGVEVRPADGSKARSGDVPAGTWRAVGWLTLERPAVQRSPQPLLGTCVMLLPARGLVAAGELGRGPRLQAAVHTALRTPLQVHTTNTPAPAILPTCVYEQLEVLRGRADPHIHDIVACLAECGGQRQQLSSAVCARWHLE